MWEVAPGPELCLSWVTSLVPRGVGGGSVTLLQLCSLVQVRELQLATAQQCLSPCRSLCSLRHLEAEGPEEAGETRAGAEEQAGG